MAVFKKFEAMNKDGQKALLTIASGPVIIRDGKVLLDKHGDDNFWKFPGGRVQDHESFQETAKREAKEELGINISIKGEPFVLVMDRGLTGNHETMILLHYLSDFSGEVSPGRDVRECKWHEVSNLPADCAPNIKPAVEFFSQ